MCTLMVANPSRAQEAGVLSNKSKSRGSIEEASYGLGGRWIGFMPRGLKCYGMAFASNIE